MADNMELSRLLILPLAMFMFILAMQSPHRWRVVTSSPTMTDRV